MPRKEEKAGAEEGELYFCGGTWEQCSSFTPGFDWVKPSASEVGKMSTSSFIPQAGENVTLIRVPPKGVEGKPCYEEIGIKELSQSDGKISLHGGGLQTVAATRGQTVEAYLDEIRKHVTNPPAPQPQMLAQSQPSPQPQYFQGTDGRLYYYTQPQSYGAQAGGSDYQSIAYSRAAAIAANGYNNFQGNTAYHYKFGSPPPGVFEGFGVGGPNPPTCVPPNQASMTLVADAQVQSGGFWFRVRMWKYPWAQ
jgi:hypothetical protein